MPLLDIVKFPDPRLRLPTALVTNIDDNFRRLIDDMYETMYDSKGVGLAANQVGIQQRFFVLDASEERNQPQCVINPEILSMEEMYTAEEGCLSVEGAYDKVQRARKVHMRGMDLEGKTFEWHAEDFLAHVIQHEVDHLQGKLFIDYLSRLKQERILKKVQKQLRHE